MTTPATSLALVCVCVCVYEGATGCSFPLPGYILNNNTEKTVRASLKDFKVSKLVQHFCEREKNNERR